MSDYIKREDALKAVNGIHEDDLPRNNKIEVCDVLTIVVPSADVAPVRHGRWIPGMKRKFVDLDNAARQYKELGYPHRTYINLSCSCCKMVVIVDNTIKYEYCPNCGAKMDGEENV